MEIPGKHSSQNEDMSDSGVDSSESDRSYEEPVRPSAIKHKAEALRLIGNQEHLASGSVKLDDESEYKRIRRKNIVFGVLRDVVQTRGTVQKNSARVKTDFKPRSDSHSNEPGYWT